MPEPRDTIGWDIGGAHAKACRVGTGAAGGPPRVRDIVQWPCALWQGQDRLAAVFEAARARWPDLPALRQAATMTGEMVDYFPDRAEGTARLAAQLAGALGPGLRLYAGLHDAGPKGAGGHDADPNSAGSHRAEPPPGGTPAARWCDAAQAARDWAPVASANWAATAQWAAAAFGDGLLVDIGSTTTDLIALRGGRLADARPRGDAARLAGGELVYQGVVRTPLCALGQQLPFRGGLTGVMNEWFATSADVHRLLGGLDPAHDQQPTADGAGKDEAATCRRLARMVGCDAADADAATWRALARVWRDRQRDAIAEALRRVAARAAQEAGLPADAPLVAAGCGEFLVPALAEAVGRPWCRLADRLPLDPAAEARDGPALRRWAMVAAPAVAVALLAAGPEGAWPCG
ncbi:hydantoinase/oxoprolinase family protein [Piscinibacter sakaiensis]|uniref:COG1548 family protein n=1 Tax=Piscinibacter sakaiensis TaxID=1547922 RepID=A0A0K8P4W9_PISS1|nr:hydantoinase/oxoprolinase family protein [Piscinibacter sakaiensis]GAP37723.1 COG1548 family protein [Piscinibacter sakaiensis]